MRRCLNCMNEYPDEYGDLCPSCGYMDGTTLNGGVYLQAGSILQGRYIVGTVIKERDTDIIYIGWDALFDRRVQIQEYFPRYCATRSGKSELSIYDNKQEMYLEGLELFYQQSRQLIRLYKEEDVVTYHACFRENKTAYAVMDYSQDITLKKRLENSLFRVDEAQDCLNEAMEAVQKAHGIGVVHGQISPESFWEKPGGGLVLKDFGAARYVSGEPGIVDYGNAGPHTDVYGLAKMFCQLITGKEIEDGEKLEGELSRRQIHLKKPVIEALKRALLHQTRTMEAFQKELWGRKKVAQSRRQKKKDHGSLSLPRWVIAAAALVMAGLLVFTGLVVAGKIDLQMQLEESRLSRGKTRVPNVVNKSREEAEELLKKSGLNMIAGEMKYSEDVEENMVSYQSIRENTIVSKKTEIVVDFSLGPEKGVFPSIIGKSLEEAEKALNEAGFVKIREEPSQEEGIYNSVLYASEEAEKQVALSKEIVLTICKNQTAQDGDETVQVEVPDIAKMKKEDAKSALNEAGLQVNWTEETSEQEEGTVLGQEPKAGETVNKESFVTVRISIGAGKRYMVNVELESLEDAEKMIADLGLSVGEVTKVYKDSVDKGKVISQSIAKGTEVKPDNKVDLVVSLGAEPAKPTSAPKPKETQPPVQTQPPALPPAQTQAPSALEQTQTPSSEADGNVSEKGNAVNEAESSSAGSMETGAATESPDGAGQAGVQGQPPEKPNDPVGEDRNNTQNSSPDSAVNVPSPDNGVVQQ